MKKLIRNGCLMTVKLLLCVFLMLSLSCRSLKVNNTEVSKMSSLLLTVKVTERDFLPFIQKMKELNITPSDVIPNVSDPDTRISVLFRFTTKDYFLLCRSEILSTGLIRQIN